MNEFYPNVGYAYEGDITKYVCLYCGERFDEPQKAESCCEVLRDEDDEL